MKVKNFAGFMKTKLNESEEMEKYEAGLYGANPEDDDMAAELEGLEDEDLEDEGMEEEEVTLEDLKAMVEELTARVEALEGGDEEEDEDAEGEEDEDAEGEEDLEGEEEEV